MSSQGLAEQFHLNAAQIRKDLAHFGEFGVRGVGYYVKDLRRHLREILGLDRQLKVVIMGAGNLGLALADYPGFRHDGFDVVALSTPRARRSGSTRAAACRFATPASSIGWSSASASTSPCWRCRPKSRRRSSTPWSAPASRPSSTSRPAPLRVPKGVKLKNVDLTVSLESLSFFLARGVDVPEVPERPRLRSR